MRPSIRRRHTLVFYGPFSGILTYFRLSKLTLPHPPSHTVHWKSQISVLGISGYVILIFAKLFAISGDPVQMPTFGASDQGLHCLPVTLLGVRWGGVGIVEGGGWGSCRGGELGSRLTG